MRNLRFLTIAVAAVAAVARFVEAETESSLESTRATTTTRRIRGAQHQDHRGLVLGGTPTGGGKYPFLVIVDWDDNVTDPRDSSSIICQGTMVARDVVLAPCLPRRGYVLVGDAPRNETQTPVRSQIRLVDPDRDAVAHPQMRVTLFKIQPVTFEGFVPIALNKDPDTPYVGQNLTAAGYGKTSAASSKYPGEVYETKVRVKIADDDDTFFLDDDVTGPWDGDRGVSLFDSSMSLVGLGYYVDSQDATLLGYPWVLLPNGTDSVQGRGFHPVRVTQWPPPETPLWRDTTTHVVITAYDAWGIPRNCTWYAIVPPLVELGIQTVSVRNGTFTDEFRLSGQVREGRVYTLRAGLASRLRGRKAIRRLAARGKSQGAGTSLRTILRDRNNKQTGRLLTILENEKKAAGRVPGVHVTFSQEGTSDVSIEMQVTENGRDNSLTVTAYGQIKQYV